MRSNSDLKLCSLEKTLVELLAVHADLLNIVHMVHMGSKFQDLFMNPKASLASL